MKVIGLAGATGCGKSRVARELATREGAVWIDLDRLAWDTYRPRTPTYRQLVSRYGKGILDSEGAIDRARLGKIVFRDSEALADLDAIVHPAVTTRLRETIRQEERQKTEVLLVEGALLASSPHVDRSLFDVVLWLEASSKRREERLRNAGRGDQINRAPPHPALPHSAGEKVVMIDAEGTISQTAALILNVIEGL
ncbi:dephospho-CoA kinase [Candidatus Bipolaricaulota bacterium]|nr:dephospho-CoA kinase [Candidatus Bipolaricaulota bacterium]